MMTRFVKYLLTVTLLLGFGTAILIAQDTPPIPDNIDTSNITDDEVNAIANQLYCPVCENIPLDTCGTAACDDWREEIRGMIAADMEEEAIIDNFVTRFGDRVVGSPRHPVIAALSVYVPLAVVIFALGFALYRIMQWIDTPQKVKSTPVSDTTTPASDDSKRNSLMEQLEQDLAGG